MDLPKVTDQLKENCLGYLKHWALLNKKKYGIILLFFIFKQPSTIRAHVLNWFNTNTNNVALEFEVQVEKLVRFKTTKIPYKKSISIS